MPRRQRDEDRDWRATLFVWRGVLEVSEDRNSFRWGGVWVPTDTDTLPDYSDKRYEDSQNEFDLQSRVYRGQDEIEILESYSDRIETAEGKLLYHSSIRRKY